MRSKGREPGRDIVGKRLPSRGDMSSDIASATVRDAGADVRRRELRELLEPLPEASGPVGELSVSTERRDAYHLERLVLDLNGLEPVPALFVKPLDSEGRLPTVLYHHAHGENFVLGKDELTDGR